jgi:hypothetical protein
MTSPRPYRDNNKPKSFAEVKQVISEDSRFPSTCGTPGDVSNPNFCDSCSFEEKSKRRCHKQWSHFVTSQFDRFEGAWADLASHFGKLNEKIYHNPDDNKKPNDPSLPLFTLIANTALLDYPNRFQAES